MLSMVVGSLFNKEILNRCRRRFVRTHKQDQAFVVVVVVIVIVIVIVAVVLVG